MSLDDYEMLLAEQNGVCAICGQPEPIQDGRAMPVDHDHATGQVRGILCSRCNRALGLMRDDSEVLFAAAVYLTEKKI